MEGTGKGRCHSACQVLTLVLQPWLSGIGYHELLGDMNWVAEAQFSLGRVENVDMHTNDTIVCRLHGYLCFKKKGNCFLLNILHNSFPIPFNKVRFKDSGQRWLQLQSRRGDVISFDLKQSLGLKR